MNFESNAWEQREKPSGASHETGCDAAVVEDGRNFAGDELVDSPLELLRTFVSDTPKQLEKLKIAAQALDAVTLKSVAHYLKGSAICVGAGLMTRLSKEVEFLAVHDLANATNAVAALDLEAARVCAILESRLNNATERKTMEQPIRILIADDHPVVRMGLRHLLQSEEAFTVVGESNDGDSTLDLVRRLKPDAVVLDVNMPGRSGLDVLRQLSGEPGTTRCILLTGGIEKQQLVEALQLGARGVITKDAAAFDLVEAIHAVNSGQYWIGGQSAAALADALLQLSSRRPQPQRFGLTNRELQVVSAVVDGCTNRDIAQVLSISEDTVKRHLTNIFDKLGVSNRLELGLFAIHHHLIAAS